MENTRDPTKSPLVSVVMSVFNGARFVEEAVRSILDQTFGDFEFIIVDDGSTDGSDQLIRHYAYRDVRVQMYNRSRSGLVDALNFGCRMAKGKYIARMDADDIALPDRLTRQFRFMEANPSVAVVGGAVQFIDEGGRAFGTAHHPGGEHQIRRALLRGSTFWHPTVLMRKDALDAVSGYRKIPDAEDYDLWLRLAEQFSLRNLDEVLLKYRIHPGQVSVTKCRSQAYGTVAVQTAARWRRDGRADPLAPVKEINLALLKEIGVSDSLLQTALARAYLSCLRNLIRAGEHANALAVLKSFEFQELDDADTWVIADLWLGAAKLHWAQGELRKSAFAFESAILRRPLLLARPLKFYILSLQANLHNMLRRRTRHQAVPR